MLIVFDDRYHAGLLCLLLERVRLVEVQKIGMEGLESVTMEHNNNQTKVLKG